MEWLQCRPILLGLGVAIGALATKGVKKFDNRFAVETNTHEDLCLAKCKCDEICVAKIHSFRHQMCSFNQAPNSVFVKHSNWATFYVAQ